MAKNSIETQATTFEDDEGKLLRRYLELYKISWGVARDYFNKANEDVALFEQQIDPDTHPTLSEITLGEARKMVDQALPVIMQYIFGADFPFELIPYDAEISYDTARKVRDLVLFNMMTNMQIETAGFFSIKDAVKLGVGYGIVEPKIITPPQSDEKVAAGVVEGKGFRESLREMTVGKPKQVCAYNYLSFGCVIPTPDGPTPDKVTCTFVLRTYNEETFRKMLDKKYNSDTPFSGDANKIIDYARRNSFNGYLQTTRQLAAKIANFDKPSYEVMNATSSLKTPIMIPVLQCYARDEHIWFACDKFKIYHAKSKYQTLRSPVVKATFDPDGSQWYTEGIIRPRRRMIMGVETFWNAVMDIMSMLLHPHQLINREAMISDDAAPDLQPYGKTSVTGDPAKALSWVFPPPMPSFAFEAGAKLEEFKDSSSGQPRQLQGQGTPGLVRGGSGAMESLLQGTMGREKLQAKHIENGWYSSVAENTLILCQLLAKDKEFLKDVEYDPEKGGNKFALSTITRSDIRRVYRVQLTFSEKMRNELAEASMRAMKYDRFIKNENVSRKEALCYLIGEEKQFRRLTSGVDVEQNLAIMQGMGGGGTQDEPAVEGALAGAGLAGGGLTI